MSVDCANCARARNQQEQLEREVAELRKELADARALSEALGEEWRKAGVVEERDTLRANLSESERKLAELRDGAGCNCAPCHMDDCPVFPKPPYFVPTGGEPAKPECPHGVGLCTASCPSKQKTPAPPAAEAPPKFRVGQRVRWNHSRDCYPTVTIESLPTSGYGADVRHEDGAVGIADIRDLEPLPDPVPPRPGRNKLLGSDHIADGFLAELGCTVRDCLGCGCLVAGGPTRCKRCAGESEQEEGKRG